MSIAEAFAEHLSKEGYHPRSAKHSDFLSHLIIRDLLEGCPRIRQRAETGELVAKLCHHQQVGHDDWVIDIALGSCAGKPTPPAHGEHIRLTQPAIIQIAVELKSIITEHGKARRNRLRDFNAFHGYAHHYNPKTIAAAFLVVNSGEYFYSPLRLPDDITKHGSKQRSAAQVAQEATNIFRAINLRNSLMDPPGLEAIGVIVVEHDNLAVHPTPEKYKTLHKSTRVAPVPPSLPVGDPMHYDTMIQRICNAYSERFDAVS